MHDHTCENTCQHLLKPLHACLWALGYTYSHACVCRENPSHLWSILLLTHSSAYIPLHMCTHRSAHSVQTPTFALDLCSILQGGKPNEPRDIILIPIIFLSIRLQICSLRVICQAGEGYPINGEEGSREQPEKSGVKLTFWREPSTHSYY